MYKVLAASRPRSIVSDPKALFLGAECFAVICESVICVVISCEAEPEQTLNYFEYVGTRKERWCSRKCLTDSRLQQYAAKRRGEKANYTTAE